MARRRRKSKKKSMDFKLTIYGILLIACSILGFGNFGVIGRTVSCGSMYLFGAIYMVILAILIIIGLYLIFKREWPDFFSTKMVGIYLLLIGVLMLLHKDFVSINDGVANEIFKNTISQLNNCCKELFDSGSINNLMNSGGGVFGMLFAILFSTLCSYTGMYVISIIFIIIGFLLFIGFSIIDFISERYDDHKSKKASSKVEKKEKKFSLFKRDDEEEDNEDDGEQIGMNFSEVPINGQTAIGKKKINSIDELTKKEEIKLGKEEKEEIILVNENYQLPPLDLLNKPKNTDNEVDRKSVEANFKKLIEVLGAFGITAKPVNVSVGPSVSQYELSIASGTRLNKVTALNAEIASALAKKDVRIQAPIPGKSTVGIEFANDESTPVSFYEIMASEKMQNNFDKKLMVPLGKNIMGDIGVCEINKMPHMLIAGTTGSGKSVCVNGVICSILMRARPDEVKLAMVDPKVVELSVYNDIPHLLAPVVSDPKKAAVLLAKMVQEMEDRYKKFSQTSTKKIEAYNEYIEKWNKKHPDDVKQKMPYIVVIIDELSDLMMVAAKEVEDSILRITQKARAAGIHLIVATQRPSTEVITGLIKANIPSRIAFAVGSGIDSRTILDKVGAEKLLGKGDMLYMPIGVNNPERIQGSFITDGEIKKLIDFVAGQQEACYDNSFTNLDTVENTSSIDGSSINTGSDEDPLYNEVVEFVITSQKASASLIQRKFKVGYNRAARLVDILEENGIIGPQNGSKPREVLVQMNEDTGEIQ